VIALEPRLFDAYQWLRGIAYVTAPGVIFVGPDGTRLRILADGSAEEIGEVPRRRSIASDPTATRRP